MIFPVRRRRASAPVPAAKFGLGPPQNAAPGRLKKLSQRAERDAAAAVDGQMPGEAPQPLTLNHPASNPGRVKRSGFSSSRQRIGPGVRTLLRDDIRLFG